MLFAVLGCEGCVGQTRPVRVHVENAESGAPLDRVSLRAFPPIRLLPSFPTTFGVTDQNGDALLEWPEPPELLDIRFSCQGEEYGLLWSGTDSGENFTCVPDGKPEGARVRVRAVPISRSIGSTSRHD